MRKLFSLIAAVLFAGSMMAADELKATLDFTGTAWNIPTSGTNTESAQFTDGTYTITLEATTNYKQNSGYLILGKANSTLTLPAFEWKTTKICITGTSGASESVKQNIFVGETAVSDETTGAKNVTNEYAIAADYQAAGNVYVLKVTSAHNTQISKIEVYTEGEGPEELSFDFKVDQEGITITPSNNDPWAGMALPTAEIIENFGTIDALVDAVKDMMEPIQGKYTLKFEDLDPEEFPAGTECTFVAWGLVEGAVTTIGSIEFVVPAPLADPTNCAEAAAAALSVEKNGDLYNGGKEYTIEGYVTEIATAYNDQYHNISFWMADEKDGGKVLEAYRAACAAEADAPAVGDKVKVTGKLTKYGETPEFAAGCTFVITEKAEPIVEDGWAKILFTEPVAAADLAADAEFALLGSDFKVKITDPDNKMSIDANACRFGSAEEYVMYSHRLKTGGKTSGEKNFITATIPADGILRLAVRTGSNSDNTRTLIVAQGADTLYNQVISESMAVKVMEGETEVSVYPYVEIAVKAGAVALSYPVNGLNFYLFAFAEEEPALKDPTNCAEAAEAALSVSENNELYNGGKEYTIEGYVTEIQTAYSDQYHNITFWMADEKDGGKVLEAYRAACASAEDAPAVGDKVKVTGALTKYNTTPEFAAGCTFVITEKAVPVDENEVVKLGFNLPTENRPADNSIEIAGSFVEGTMALEKVEATGWFLSYDFVKAVADDTFKLRDKSNNDLILCKYNEGKAIWEQAIFTFGDYWQDDTWKGTPCKLIEEDLSNAAEYAWKEGAPEPGEELVDPTNCAEAAEAALSVSENNELYNGGKEYTIEGYVTEIQTAYSDQYHNITFWMADEKDGGKVLEAFRAACASAEDAVRVGDKVKVTGALTKYNTTPEFAAGCTYEIIERGEQPDPKNLGEKTIAEFLELKNKIDTCILTGAIDSVVNTVYGNFYLKDATATVYVYGLLTAAGEAKKCFEEEGLQVGDIITIKAIYNEYNNNPQVKNAIFVRKKGQGIDNTSVEIKVEKFFRDGQLIIRKNGIEYNVQGAVIK